MSEHNVSMGQVTHIKNTVIRLIVVRPIPYKKVVIGHHRKVVNIDIARWFIDERTAVGRYTVSRHRRL